MVVGKPGRGAYAGSVTRDGPPPRVREPIMTSLLIAVGLVCVAAVAYALWQWRASRDPLDRRATRSRAAARGTAVVSATKGAVGE